MSLRNAVCSTGCSILRTYSIHFSLTVKLYGSCGIVKTAKGLAAAASNNFSNQQHRRDCLPIVRSYWISGASAYRS